MVCQTQPTNKTAHPAAPVMSTTAKVKAGITPAKPCAKQMTKDARIQELEAQIAQFKNPDDQHLSKEPLVRASLLISYAHSLTLPSFSVLEVPEVMNLEQKLTPIAMTMSLLVESAPDNPITNSMLYPIHSAFITCLPLVPVH